MKLPDYSDIRIAIIGLGYVGLPLAAYMARHFPVLGYDIRESRVAELKQGIDVTREVTDEEFRAATKLEFTNDREALRACNFFIVTVPTPVDEARRPDFRALLGASECVGAALQPGGVVVYESTVYPGATEEVCVPIIERVSGLKFNQDFVVGYSPERINPGDREHRLPSIMKVTSGSTPAAADLIDRVYATVVTAGTYKASSIKVAEAAKVIENVQRDVNIALINELAMLFNRLGIQTGEVLAASGSKWNFHKYMPGLVGGHCIGVDPYYLTHKAQSIGFHSEMVLAGRRINDGMAAYFAQEIIRKALHIGKSLSEMKILVMGLTFKENCPDLRNTKVADLIAEIGTYVHSVTVYDPLADKSEAMDEYSIVVENDLPAEKFDVIVLAVRHQEIVARLRDEAATLLKDGGFVYDIRAAAVADAV